MYQDVQHYTSSLEDDPSPTFRDILRPSPVTRREDGTLTHFPVLGRYSYVLTFRGALLFLFALFLLLGPARTSKDIIALIVGSSILGLLSLFSVLTLLKGRTIRKEVNFSMSAPGADSESPLHSTESGTDLVPSGAETLVHIRVSSLKLLPGYYFQFRINLIDGFTHLGYSSAIGARPTERLFKQRCFFPHRGEWRAHSSYCCLGDRLGLTEWYWKTAPTRIEGKFLALPGEALSETLPVVSSSYRSGDDVFESNRRQGDLYDLKAYHPSDGIRRLVWKIFARSGELVSRHPEPSMTPEGELVSFIVADRWDDQVCSLAHSYFQKLERLNIRMHVGMEGCEESDYAMNSEAALLNMIRSVWNTGRGSLEVLSDYRRFISLVQQRLQHSNIRTVLVFGSMKRLLSEPDFSLFLQLGEELDRNGIVPFFAIVGEEIIPETVQRTLKQRIIKFLIESEEEGSGMAEGPSLRSNLQQGHFSTFAQVCLDRGWQVQKV